MNRVHRRHHNSIILLFLTLVSVVCIATPVFAAEKNILMVPTRLIFEGKTRSAVVKLINPDNKSASYRISLITTRMDEHGKKVRIDSPNEAEKIAQKLIRFSPRRVTIPPNGWQTVRLMVRKPKDLPDGEYRTGLKVAPIIEQNSEAQSQDGQKGVGVNIEIVFAAAIPIIVRHGQGNATIIPQAPKLITRNDKYFLEVPLERSGLFSSYFNVEAFFTPSGKTQKIEIGSNKGMAIYAENQNRLALVPVKNIDLLTNGSIEIRVTSREKDEGALLASKIFSFSK